MEEVQSSSNKNYISVREDPEALLLLVDKFVKVQLIKNYSYIGFIHSIDPVTYSIILSVVKEDIYQTIILPGYAIQEVTEQETTEHKPPLRKQSSESSETILHRKKTILAYFSSNSIPIKEVGDDLVVGSAKILRPYTTLDICTENPVIAMSIRKTLDDMPVDFQPE